MATLCPAEHLGVDRQRRAELWALAAAVVALACFLFTLQWDVNGSQSPYATDVGEIQNALPRWGTIHFTGYPQYTFLGSLFVTAVRPLGVAPAAGSSLLSALWGAAAVFLLAVVAGELGVAAPVAAAASIVAALTRSAWIDASLAEVHTMSMALSLGALYAALRFARTGKRSDLLWLVVCFTQGVAHQRAVAFWAPTLTILVGPRWRECWCHRWMVLGLAALAPLTYLYLPLRQWMGADWTFGAPGTWRGFWTMILDTKAERIISWPGVLTEWLDRTRTVGYLLHADLPLPWLALGMLGLGSLALRGRRRAAAGLWVALIVHLGLCLLIWEGRVSDALLAAKLPCAYLAALGLGVAGSMVGRRSLRLCAGFAGGLAVLAVALFLRHQADVRAITRDPAAETVIAQVVALEQAATPTTLLALWGHDYWALTYAQRYRPNVRDDLGWIELVDHNADIGAIVDGGHRLLTLSRTFYERPRAWWEDELGPIALDMVAPGVVQVSRRGVDQEAAPPGLGATLGNGVRIASARLVRGTTGGGEQDISLEVYWQAETVLAHDSSVAVHLLAHDPPRGGEDILAQADRAHPVDGWYPTSTWIEGEIVRDWYVLPDEEGATAIRIGMYRQENGAFLNTEWLVLPLVHD